jgi:hypothetical protein
VHAIITTRYIHPKVYKDEIEKTINELLNLGYIRPSSSPFASSVVLVKMKYGTLCMYVDCRAFAYVCGLLVLHCGQFHLLVVEISQQWPNLFIHI